MDGAVTNFPPPKGWTSYPESVRPTHPDRGLHRGARWDVLSRLARGLEWRRMVEVGVADGRTSAALLRHCPRLSLVMVDPWAPQPGTDGPEDWADWPHARFEAAARAVAARYAGRCDVLKMRSVDAAATFADQTFDAVFLDADHSEAGVRADIAAWVPKIKPSGWLVGHDINWPGVRAAVEIWYPRYQVCGDNVWIIQI